MREGVAAGSDKPCLSHRIMTIRYQLLRGENEVMKTTDVFSLDRNIALHVGEHGLSAQSSSFYCCLNILIAVFIGPAVQTSESRVMTALKKVNFSVYFQVAPN